MSTIIAAGPEAQLPEHYEVVNGQIMEIPPMSGFAGEVANRIRDELTFYARNSRRGRARNDMLFHIPLSEDKGRNREPDAAFISFERWPENQPISYKGNPVEVVPNLTVEVASPTDDAEDLLAKAHEYLRAGVELVWVVFPRLRQIYAYTAVGKAPQLFSEGDILDGAAVLPGLSIPVTGLFPIVLADDEPASDE